MREEESTQEESPRITMMDPNGKEVTSPAGSESAESRDNESRRGSDSSEASAAEVNWEELEKTEEQEPRDEGSDDVSSTCHIMQSENLLTHKVYRIFTCKTRAGKQPASHESQVRHCQSPGRRATNEKQIETAFYSTPQATR